MSFSPFDDDYCWTAFAVVKGHHMTLKLDYDAKQISFLAQYSHKKPYIRMMFFDNTFAIFCDSNFLW